MRLRNKRGSPCNVNWMAYDAIIMEHVMASAKCRPPQINSTQSLPICSSSMSMQKAKAPSYQTFSTQTPPCQSVQHSHFDEEDIDLDDKFNPPEVRLEIDSSHPTFKYIEHIKAFDAQSLIGNSGGYLGLFLGYALIQLPNAISALLSFFKN